MKIRRILAIDPGTKQIGFAVLDHSELVYYAVKTIRDRKTAQKILSQATKLVEGLIEAYRPDCLAIEKMFIVQKSAALLSVVAAEIKAVASLHALPIYEYAPSSIRKSVCGTGVATKLETARVVASQYPELARHLNASNKWEETYYANMFDAVAVALRCRMELTNQQLPFLGNEETIKQ